MLHLFTDRTSLGYSFLLFFSFSRFWGSSFGFFSADSWVRAAVAEDGGWAGRAMAGARGAGVASVEEVAGGVVDSEVLAEDRLEAAARAEVGVLRASKRSTDPWTTSWMNSSKN